MDHIPKPNLISVSDLLQVVSPQTRLEIILAIGTDEACVCHLEAVLKQRQAYISQHLMALREAGVITARREGRFIFYRLEKPEVLELVGQAMRIAGQSPDDMVAAQHLAGQGCKCPKCAPAEQDEPVQACSAQNA